MKWFLLLIILLMAGGGYYEYQLLQKQISADQDQFSDLTAKLQKAATDNSDLTASITKLKKSLADAQAKQDSLAKDLQAAQAAAAQAKAQATATASATPSATGSAATTSSSSSGPFTTKLGTITTIGGTTYANCQLMKVSAGNIVISYADGITQVQFALLPPDLQKHFGFDPKLGALTDTQVQALEQQRQAAFASGR